MAEAKKRIGWPRTNATPITVGVPPDLLAGLDAAVTAQSDAPSRPEMMRRIATS